MFTLSETVQRSEAGYSDLMQGSVGVWQPPAVPESEGVTEWKSKYQFTLLPVSLLCWRVFNWFSSEHLERGRNKSEIFPRDVKGSWKRRKWVVNRSLNRGATLAEVYIGGKEASIKDIHQNSGIWRLPLSAFWTDLYYRILSTYLPYCVRFSKTLLLLWCGHLIWRPPKDFPQPRSNISVPGSKNFNGNCRCSKQPHTRRGGRCHAILSAW